MSSWRTSNLPGGSRRNVRSLLEGLSASKSKRKNKGMTWALVSIILLLAVAFGALLSYKRKGGQIGTIRGQITKAGSSSLPPIQHTVKCEDLNDGVADDGKCTPAKTKGAAGLRRAQSILLDQGGVCLFNANGEAITVSGEKSSQNRSNCSLAINMPNDQRQNPSYSPDWVHHRDSSFGLWVYPRLKLVLFACPKCANSEVRLLLDRVSEMIVQYGAGGADMKTNVQSMRGNWSPEGEHSFQAISKNTEDGFKAMEYVDDLMANDEWTSLKIIRHPYKRLVSGYVELEFRWGLFGDVQRDKNGGYREQSMAILEEGSFWHLPLESSERAGMFWVEFVFGRFALEPTDSDQGCAKPIAESYHIHPMGSFFLRDAHQCVDSAAAYFNAEYTIDADRLHAEWPSFIRRWEHTWNETVATSFAAMAGEHKNTKALNPNAKTMKELLEINHAFKESVDALYSDDFERYGFAKDLKILAGHSKEG